MVFFQLYTVFCILQGTREPGAKTFNTIITTYCVLNAAYCLVTKARMKMSESRRIQSNTVPLYHEGFKDTYNIIYETICSFVPPQCNNYPDLITTPTPPDSRSRRDQRSNIHYILISHPSFCCCVVFSYFMEKMSKLL